MKHNDERMNLKGLLCQVTYKLFLLLKNEFLSKHFVKKEKKKEKDPKLSEKLG